MRTAVICSFTLGTLLALRSGAAGQTPPPQRAATILADATWLQAKERLTPDAVVVFALGAASKEHGPHLPLATDYIQAEFVKDRVAERADVIVAPSIDYGFYPPFAEYPGSTTLRLSVSRDMVADICRSLARSSGARRFYVVNHGIITAAALRQAATLLEAEGLLLRFTDLDAARDAAVKQVLHQEKGSHADEIETSMMLYMAPDKVHMDKAVKEYGRAEDAGGYMIGNRPERNGLFSPSGVFGDPTLATREKGELITRTLVEATLRDIEDVRRAPLPSPVALETLFTEVTGRYQMAPGDVVTVSRDGDMLAVDRPGHKRVRLQAVGKRVFGLWMTEARFFTDADGTVTHMLLSADGRDEIGMKVK